MDLPKSTLTKKQKQTRSIAKEGQKLTVHIRHDDACGNGHNTFAITGELFEKRAGRWAWVAGGCLHDEIVEFFPELADYIKWHGCSTDGPMHYIANTLYQAGDKDCWGLREGEKRQLINGRTKKPSWQLAAIRDDGEELPLHELPKYADGDEPPKCEYTLAWRPWCRVGEGKEPELEAARSAAIWPDATLDQLRDKKQLEDRLPGLMEEFKAAVEALGFNY